jgi:uncharacterized membrane protein YkoI
MAASSAQDRGISVGNGITSQIREILATRKSEIESQIYKIRYIKVEKSECLPLIEERQSRFAAILDEVASDRLELINALKNGTITQEVFTVGMKDLGLKVAISAKAMNEMKDDLTELQVHIEEKHLPRFGKLEKDNHRLQKKVIDEEQAIEIELNKSKHIEMATGILISREDAIKIAKGQAGLGTEVKGVSLKTSDGESSWKIELVKQNGAKIEIVVDTKTGAILELIIEYPEKTSIENGTKGGRK